MLIVALARVSNCVGVVVNTYTYLYLYTYILKCINVFIFLSCLVLIIILIRYCVYVTFVLHYCARHTKKKKTALGML